MSKLDLFQAGAIACSCGLDRETNPHKAGTNEHHCWNAGYDKYSAFLTLFPKTVKDGWKNEHCNGIPEEAPCKFESPIVNGFIITNTDGEAISVDGVGRFVSEADFLAYKTWAEASIKSAFEVSR